MIRDLSGLTCNTYAGATNFAVYEDGESHVVFAVVWLSAGMWRADIRNGYWDVTVPTETEARLAVERAWVDPDGVPYPNEPEGYVATTEVQKDHNGRLSKWGYTEREGGDRGYFRVRVADEAR